jgi:hypothetical protein
MKKTKNPRGMAMYSSYYIMCPDPWKASDLKIAFYKGKVSHSWVSILSVWQILMN